MPSDKLQLDQQNINFDAQFLNSDGTPKDLTGDTPIDMEFRKPDNSKVTEATITVVDLTTGQVRYTEATTAKTNIIGAWEYRPITLTKIKGEWIQFIVSD